MFKGWLLKAQRLRFCSLERLKVGPNFSYPCEVWSNNTTCVEISPGPGKLAWPFSGHQDLRCLSQVPAWENERRRSQSTAFWASFVQVSLPVYFTHFYLVQRYLLSSYLVASLFWHDFIMSHMISNETGKFHEEPVLGAPCNSALSTSMTSLFWSLPTPLTM